MLPVVDVGVFIVCVVVPNSQSAAYEIKSHDHQFMKPNILFCVSGKL